jgi:hypothetical protein
MLNRIRAAFGGLWRPRRRRTGEHGFHDQGEASPVSRPANRRGGQGAELPASARSNAYVRLGRVSSSGRPGFVPPEVEGAAGAPA